jgi:4-hydroxy-tetrahydrodipicolinate synthase
VDILPKGLITALITPMLDGHVDWKGFEHLIEEQISAAVAGIVIAGTTGEAATLTDGEYHDLLTRAVQIVSGRTFLIAGTGSNATATAVTRTCLAERLGYDGALVVAPYYNKPSPAGVFSYYAAIAQACSYPIISYSIPARCGIEITTDTLFRLSRIYPHICGHKEAGGDCSRISILRNGLGENFRLYAGDCAMTLPFMAIGADGVISACANVLAKEMGEMVQLALANNFRMAMELHLQLLPIFRALFCEVNPVPIKWVLKELGSIASAEVRAPLAPLEKENLPIVSKVVRELGEIGGSQQIPGEG